jgi:hypothetical protein
MRRLEQLRDPVEERREQRVPVVRLRGADGTLYETKVSAPVELR